MRPLTKLGLRLLLHLEGQRVYTTLSPSVHQALLAPRLTPPPRWQNLERDSPAKVPVSSNNHSKEAQQCGVAKKGVDTTKGVAPNATKPPNVPQDRYKEKEVPPRMEIVLATLPVPDKGDLKSKGSESSKAALS